MFAVVSQVIEFSLVLVGEVFIEYSVIQCFNKTPASIVPKVTMNHLLVPGLIGKKHLGKRIQDGILPLCIIVFRHRAVDPFYPVLLQGHYQFCGIGFLRHVDTEPDTAPNVGVVQKSDGRVFSC